MTKQEENKYSMYLAVKEALSGHQAAVDAVPALKTVCTEFYGVLEAIAARDIEYQTAAKGKGQEKEQAEDLLIARMTDLAGPLYVYGRKTGNENIKALMRLKETHLRKMRDTALLQKAKSVLDYVEEHKAALGPYGIAGTAILDYKKNVEAFEISITGGEAKSNLSTASRQILKELFTRADELLKEDIDFLMEPFKAVQGDFYPIYRKARNIKDL